MFQEGPRVELGRRSGILERLVTKRPDQEFRNPAQLAWLSPRTTRYPPSWFARLDAVRHSLNYRFLLILLGPVLGSVLGCSRVEPAQSAMDLRLNLGLAPGIEIFAPKGDLRDRCRLVASWGTDCAAEVLSAPAASDPGRARIVVGTRATPGLAGLAQNVGAEFSEGGFTWEGKLYSEAGDALIFTIEDPERPGLPLSVYLGNDEVLLARYITDLTPCAKPSVASYERGRLTVTAKTTLRGDVIDRSVRDRSRFYEKLSESLTRSLALECGVSLSTGESVDELQFDRYTEAAERSAKRVLDWLDAPGGSSQPISVRLYRRIEDFRELHGHPRQAVVGRVTGDVDVLFERDVPHDSGAGIALGIALTQVGPAQVEWLEHGLSVDSADAWWGQDLRTWTKHLVQLEGPLAVEQLVAPRADSMHSPHRVRPLQAMLCRYLRELHGSEGLLAVWVGDQEFAPLSDEFAAWLEKELAGVADLPSRIEGADFMRGVCLLESEDVLHGTDEEAHSLAEAVAHGVNSVSIVSYTRRLPERPRYASYSRGAGIDSVAGDVALAATIAEAHRTRLSVQLTPHYLTAPSGSWAGTEVRSSKDGWEQFFEQRSIRLVDHFALLGELCEVELLSLGSELTRTSSAKVDPQSQAAPPFAAWKLAGWQDTIRRARSSFRGALTYTSTWPQEAELIEFWEDLDYVTCTLYARFQKVPGAEGDSPDDATIIRSTKSRLKKMLELADGLGKPLLIGEMGMASTSSAWRRPRSAEGEVDLESQARFLRGMGAALVQVRQESKGLAGVFLWNWWTDSFAGGAEGAGYSPQNKPAGEVLRDVYSKL